MKKKKMTPIRTLDWGEKIYLEIPIFKYVHQFFAQYGENADGQEYIEFYKFGPMGGDGEGFYRQRMRLYKPYHWTKIKEIVKDELAPAIGWSLSEEEDTVRLTAVQRLTKELEQKKKKVKLTEKKLKEQEDIIKELIDNLAIYKKQYTKNEIPKYKMKLKEFKKLISSDLKEQKYQEFLKQNFWMFGLEYINTKSQKRAGSSDIPDYTLEKYDTYHDVVEIKRPGHNVFVKKSKRLYQSSELKDAISECMDYVDYFDSQYKDEYWDTRENYYKTKGIVIIGNKLNASEKSKLKQLNSYLHRIEVLTYHDLVCRADNIIKFYEKK